MFYLNIDETGLYMYNMHVINFKDNFSRVMHNTCTLRLSCDLIETDFIYTHQHNCIALVIEAPINQMWTWGNKLHKSTEGRGHMISDVIWASWRPRSPGTGRQIAQADINENISYAVLWGNSSMIDRFL